MNAARYQPYVQLLTYYTAFLPVLFFFLIKIFNSKNIC